MWPFEGSTAPTCVRHKTLLPKLMCKEEACAACQPSSHHNLVNTNTVHFSKPLDASSLCEGSKGPLASLSSLIYTLMVTSNTLIMISNLSNIDDYHTMMSMCGSFDKHGTPCSQLEPKPCRGKGIMITPMVVGTSKALAITYCQ